MKLEIVLFHLNLLIKLHSGTIFISAHYKPDADGKFENQNNDEIIVSISIAECDMRCSLNPRCVSFFYNTLTKLCILHSNPFTYTVIPNSGTEWRFYETRDPDIELVYDDPICMQGKNTGDGWKFLDGTLMTYFKWGHNQPKFLSNQLRMVIMNHYKWFTTPDTKSCSYLCEYP
ncbi:Hypothetical predicted protein [Mytilus galloprovincialis]|uniref:Apple domain-containing protein n=1 Tax=Mytilus galloprovincialis TaxID=29158 RepID=A0A8B6F6A5_MYTGA|nr:Hypothetical predicted protein [Mytilus galloprovincialis]